MRVQAYMLGYLRIHYLIDFSYNIRVISCVSFIIKINNNARNIILILIYWSKT